MFILIEWMELERGIAGMLYLRISVVSCLAYVQVPSSNIQPPGGPLPKPDITSQMLNIVGERERKFESSYFIRDWEGSMGDNWLGFSQITRIQCISWSL